MALGVDQIARVIGKIAPIGDRSETYIGREILTYLFLHNSMTWLMK